MDRLRQNLGINLTREFITGFLLSKIGLAEVDLATCH